VIELVARRPDVTSGPRSITVRAGELLCRQGGASDLGYVVRTGSVDVFRQLAAAGPQSSSVR
jgi:CRP-like cAMP-binding protein